MKLPAIIAVVIPSLLPCSMAGSISRSIAMPVVNQAVALTLSPDLAGSAIDIAGPLGSSQLATDAGGSATWTPARYGKYTLSCGDASRTIWVTARPMKFHWWSCTQAQQHVTEVMQVNADWEARGVSQVQWTGGEAYSRGVDGHNWSTPIEWYNGWSYAYSADGMALDEIFCNDGAPMDAIIEAVGMVRQAKGPDYSINVWSAGFGGSFASGAAKLKAANTTILIEDYYGGWNNHKSRWDAVRSYGLQSQAISGIWPGTTNLTNEAEIRTDVALVRLAEPSANGIAIFAPAAGLLDACDRAIEDYYLKPLIHLSVNPGGQLIAWNLGNEDATGFSLQLLNSGNAVLQTIDLSALAANAKQTLTVPEGAVKAKVLNPPGTANLYQGNSQYSNGIFPILIPGRYTWTHANGDHLWSTFSNWNPSGPPPGNIDSGNYAYFDGNASAPTNVTAPAGEISISSVQFTSAGWTINGSPVTQDFYTYGVQSAGAGINTINIGISARDVVPASFSIGADNTLVMNGLIGAIRNNGGLIKNGAGILTATYANTFGGATSINAGTLRIGGSGSLGSGTYAANVTNAGTFDYASSANQTLSGAITGTGTLAMNGSGTLTLSGTNAYSGATTVNSGKLNFRKTATSSPGSTAYTVNAGATLQIDSSANWDGFANPITVNGGSVALNSSAGYVVYYGGNAIQMTGGSVNFQNANWRFYNFGIATHAAASPATLSGTASFTYNPALNFNVERGTAASDLNVSLPLGGTGALNKNGTGVLTLAAINGYSGVTAINSGTLQVNGSIANTATTVAAAATLGGTGSIGGSVSNSGTIAPGSDGIGTLTINNTVTLSGDSKLAWEVSDWTAAAGSGHDKLTASSLAITATPASPVTVRLKDLSLANFSEGNTSFVLVETTSGITGFSADKFIVDDSELTLPQGTWGVQQSGNQLQLAYTASEDANDNGILDTWESTHFGNANAGANLPDDDADHDGLTNLLEYALNTDPMNGNATPVVEELATVGGGKHLRLTVPKNPSATNLSYVVESCGVLDDWSTTDTTVETDNASELIVRDNFSTTTATRRFIRLRVQAVQ